MKKNRGKYESQTTWRRNTGGGQVSYEHAKAVQNNPHLYLAAVCRCSEESAKKLAAQFNPDANVYRAYEEMLADSEVNIVSVCMPNHLHAREAIQPFDANKHLISEKPTAINDEELQTLREAARKAETKSVVSFVLRWHPMVCNLKALLNKKAIGDVYYTEADYWHGIKKIFSSYG